MNPPEPPSDPHLNDLFARARAQRVDTSAMEYAFETRLLARLRTERETSSIWALVAWRMAPIFASIVLCLAVWQTQLTSESNDADAFASLDNALGVDLGENAD